MVLVMILIGSETKNVDKVHGKDYIGNRMLVSFVLRDSILEIGGWMRS